MLESDMHESCVVKVVEVRSRATLPECAKLTHCKTWKPHFIGHAISG